MMMIKLSLYLLLCEFLLFLTSSADTFSAPIWNGYQVFVLGSNVESHFNFEAEHWDSSGLLRSTRICQCGNYYVLGGPNSFSQGGYFISQFDNLPTHDIFFYSMRFMLTGSWKAADVLSLIFDSKTVDITKINLMSSEFEDADCDGTTWSTLRMYTVSGRMYHSDPSLTLKIMSDLTTSPTLASFGTRVVFLLFANNTNSYTEDYCFKIQDDVITQNVPNTCACGRGTYENAAGNCKACDDSCWDCFGASSSECYRCNAGYSWVESECIACDITCGQCSGPNSDQCVTCATDLWLYWDGTCRTSCTSSSTSQLVYDDLWICNLPCPEGQYMLWDGTCVNSCDSPLVIVKNNTGNFCDKPCVDDEFFFNETSTCIDTCDGYYESILVLDVEVCVWKCEPDQYMLWNLTCVDSCDYPLVEERNSTGIFCLKPCSDGEFYYANTSCIDSCDLPFVQSVTLDVDTCYWKCETGQYMRWDYTCWDSCDGPLEITTNSTGNFCWKPCENGEYLYSNGSCIDSCTFPFQKGEVLDVVDTCVFKCSSDEFLYTNDGSCISSCNYPFLDRDGVGAERKFCYSPCDSDEYILEDLTCSPNCTTPYYSSETVDEYTQLCLEYEDNLIEVIVKIIKTEGQISFGLMLALSIGKMGSSNSLCLASLAKMLEYIKYMRIDYSQRLDLMFQLQGSSELALNFDVPLSEGIQEKFPDHELPSNFEEYELGSSFFLNYWETLGTLLVILAGVLVLILLTLVAKGKSYNHVFMWLKTVFKWNFLLMIFCSNFEGVVFFTSLEMRTLNVDSFAAFLSVFICIIANLFALFILIKITLILKDIRKVKYQQVHDTSAESPNPHRKWKSYQVLFLHCHEKKPVQQAFFIIFLIRVYFFHLTIGYIFPDPLAQSIIITILSILMLIYLITQRPLEEKGDWIKLIINECIVLLVNLCTLVLAALDHNGKQTQGNTELFSYIIIMANLLFNTLAVILLGAESIIALTKIYKEIKAHKLKGIISLLEIFMMIFSGEAMAMEEEYLSPDVEATTTTPEKTPAKQKPKVIELETPQTNDENEKNINVTTAELLKFRSPISPSSPRSARSLADEEEEGRLSVFGRGNRVNQGRKPSETVFKFDSSSLKELDKKKPSIIVRSENASMVLLSPPKVMDAEEIGIKGESESEAKATPAKMDTTSENLKLLFTNWPEGNIVNLDD